MPINSEGALMKNSRILEINSWRIAQLGQCWWQEKVMSSQKKMSLKGIQLKPASCFSSGINWKWTMVYFIANLLEQEVGGLVYNWWYQHLWGIKSCQNCNDGVTGGYLGQDKTLMKLKERYYWPGHWNDVQDWCNTCSACISRKSSASKPRAGLQPILAGYPLQLVAIDILGPLPESTTGNSYILVVGDYFTRWMEAYPIPNQDVITVVKSLSIKCFAIFLHLSNFILIKVANLNLKSSSASCWKLKRPEPHPTTPIRWIGGKVQPNFVKYAGYL